MDKKIKIVMKEDKTISILLNEAEVTLINSEERRIDAKMIYASLKYSNGDKYTIESDNNANKDQDVLDSITNLYKEIIKEINKFNTDDKNNDD